MVGGARAGAGRKKNPHKTKSITFYIQVDWELEIRKLINDFKAEKTKIKKS